MVLVATGTHEEPHVPKKPGIQVIRVADVTRTAAQANILLGIAAQASQLLAKTSEIGTTVEIDPDAAKTAKDTYELAHVRLRDLIDDPQRWSAFDDMKQAFDTLQASQNRVLEAELELTKDRARLVRESNRPCFVLGAGVRQMSLPDGKLVWVSFIGQFPQPDGIIGEGASPEEALAAFDAAYARKIDSTSRQPDEQEPLLPVEQPPKAKKPKRKKHEKEEPRAD